VSCPSADSKKPALAFPRSARAVMYLGAMDDLPENLATLDDEALLEERTARDEKLRPLFRRWPSLNKLEMKELRRLYDERLRLAKRIGRLRRGAKRA
jgi:hypothetical protein